MTKKILDDAAEAKKYLEEVMGIVEDEEFNDRRKKLQALKRKYGKEPREKKQNTIISDRKSNDDNISNDTSCCVKVIIL